jgi:hypothetical protein
MASILTQLFVVDAGVVRVPTTTALRALAAAAAAAWLTASPARAGEEPATAAPSAGEPAAGPPALDLSAPAVPPATPSGGWPEFTDVTATSVALTAAGFLTAFVVHEGCHVVANLAMANVPTIEPVRFAGFLPFFAVSPNVHCTGGTCTRRNGEPFLPGPRGYAFVVTSGILCQEITDEIILTERPRIRYESAAFLKGMLLFNTATSLAYGIANLTGIEPPEGDLHGLDQVVGVPHGVMAAVVLGTAALDIARYFLPDSTWLPWVSRGSKVLTVGLMLSW